MWQRGSIEEIQPGILRLLQVLVFKGYRAYGR